MSDKQRAQLAMMLRTGMMDQEDYNEAIAGLDVLDVGRAPRYTGALDIRLEQAKAAKDKGQEAEYSRIIDIIASPAYEQEYLQKEQSLTCPNCGRPIEADWKFCRVCGHPLQGSQTLSYEDWLAQVDSKLMELGGFNLRHAKVMIPTLDMNRLFPGDETYASTPEETAQDILTMIEGKV